MSSLSPVVATQDTVDTIWFAGGLVSFKVTSEQSGGAFTLFEHSAGRGKMTPLHIHADSDETGYMLEGELLLSIDGVEQRVRAGETFYVPRGVPHAFLVTSEIERSLWFVTPGPVMEQFYRQAGEPAPDTSLPSPAIDIPHLVAVGERTGAMKVLGPPPFAMPAID